VVAAVTAHVLPSIMIEYKLVSVTKLVPVNVTEVPPVTVPYRGLTAVNNGVRVPEYVTVSVRLANISLFFSKAIGHTKVASELSTVSTPVIFNSATSQPLF
jgi:hypothetical protein